MGKFDWRYVAGGFVAGVVFVASCGQSVKSAAETVLQALDISFDNSGTGISATDVQGAIEELDTRTATPATGGGTWLAKDKNGVVIFEAPRLDKCGVYGYGGEGISAFNSPLPPTATAQVGYNASLDKCLRLDSNGGRPIYLAYASADCTGTPYVEIFPSMTSSPSFEIPSAIAPVDGYVYCKSGTAGRCASAASTSFEKVVFAGPAVSNFIYNSRSHSSNGNCGATSGTLASARPVTASDVTVPFEYPFTAPPTWVKN